MTRKHFELIARILDESDLSPDEHEHISSRFADELEHLNPNFDRERFLKACGVES